MIQLLSPKGSGEFLDELAAMHRLRFRIFKERLGWDAQVSSDLEVDEFHTSHAVYLRRRGDGGRIQGCNRLLPTMAPPCAATCSRRCWAGKRPAAEGVSVGRIATATHELYAGMIELGLSRHLTDIVIVTDVRVPR